MRGALAGLLTCLALLGAGPAPAAAAEAKTSLPDIEDEVMCTICGTALQLSDSPQANQQRAFISRLISEGRSKEEIKDALVDEYGPAVLAVPAAEGFDLAAWIVPIGGVLLAIVLIALAARRWRRSGRDLATTPGPGEIDPAEDERLSADLGRYGL